MSLCDELMRLCDKLMRLCDKLMRLCDKLMRLCDELMRLRDELMRLRDELMRLCDELMRLCDELMRLCDETMLLCDEKTCVRGNASTNVSSQIVSRTRRQSLPNTQMVPFGGTREVLLTADMYVSRRCLVTFRPQWSQKYRSAGLGKALAGRFVGARNCTGKLKA